MVAGLIGCVLVRHWLFFYPLAIGLWGLAVDLPQALANRTRQTSKNAVWYSFAYGIACLLLSESALHQKQLSPFLSEAATFFWLFGFFVIQATMLVYYLRLLEPSIRSTVSWRDYLLSSAAFTVLHFLFVFALRLQSQMADKLPLGIKKEFFINGITLEALVLPLSSLPLP